MFPFNQTPTMANNLVSWCEISQFFRRLKLNYKSIFILLILLLRVEFMDFLLTWHVDVGDGFTHKHTHTYIIQFPNRQFMMRKKGKIFFTFCVIALSIKIYSFKMKSFAIPYLRHHMSMNKHQASAFSDQSEHTLKSTEI